MKVETDQKTLRAEKAPTYQWPFHYSAKCPSCKAITRLLMVVDDDERVVAGQRPSKVKIWPHDAMCVAIYLCTNCGKMAVEWNQG